MSDITAEDLKGDVARCATELADKQFFSSEDVKKYMQDTIFPLLENTCEVIDGHDEDIESLMRMVEGQEDILQPETGAIFALAIKLGMDISAELVKRLRPQNEGDQKWKRRLAQASLAFKAAEAKLLEIVVQPEEVDDDEGAVDTDPPSAPTPGHAPEPANDQESPAAQQEG